MIAGGMKVSTDDWGGLYGFGLFETVRLYGGTPFLLDAHVDRMLASARELAFPIVPDRCELLRTVHRYAKRHALTDAGARFSMSYGNCERLITPAISVLHRPVEYTVFQYRNGISVRVTGARRAESSLVVRHKTFNQLENVLAHREAIRRGAREALFLNGRNQLAEGSRSNVFLIRDGKAMTTTRDCGLLPGITRSIVIDLLRNSGVVVSEEPIPAAGLHDCQEFFLVNSIMQVMPVCQIDDMPVGRVCPGEITRLAMTLYDRMVMDYQHLEATGRA